jgi:hypothetical protein
MSLEQLQAHLNTLPPGPLLETDRLLPLLAACWNNLDDTGLR